MIVYSQSSGRVIHNGTLVLLQAALRQRGVAVDSVKLLSAGVTAPAQAPSQAAGSSPNIAVIAGGAAAAAAVLAAAIAAFVVLLMRSARRRIADGHHVQQQPREPEFKAEPFYTGCVHALPSTTLSWNPPFACSWSPALSQSAY
jgi:hypothetical protein